ncbi:MAG TPA: Gldg family protein, partial [Dongiaceae bacterium]|nr:Gldg family protein [Dongiaceae bacterium]
LIDGIGMAGGPQNGYRPWQVLGQMQQFFNVRTLAGDLDKIDDDVKVLLLVHPHDLSDKTLFAIDQYVLRGGHALVFLDPLAEQMMRNQQMGMPPQGVSSNLDKLLKAWGVELVPGKVVGDRGSALQVQAMSNGRDVVTQYLPWLDLGADSLDHNDAVTGELEVLRILSAGALRSTQGATTKLTPLVQSSADAELLDSEALQLMPDPVRLLTDFKPSGERYVLAGRLSGPVKTAFPDGPPAVAPAAPATGTTGATPPSPAPTAFLKESKQPINLVLVSDADMLADTSWLNMQNVMGSTLGVPIANNADFAINAVENLAGGEALVGLRGRGLSGRPFTTVEKIRDAAEAKYRATEEQLNTQLQDVQTKLASLQTDDKGNGEQLLTPAQQDTIRQFRSQVLTIRGQLREVQHALRQDIDRLETRLMLANIGLVPALVALAALGLAVWRRVRAGRRARA